MDIIIIVGVVGLILGGGISFFLINSLNLSKANLIIEDAKKEAEQIRKEKLLQAKEKFIELKAEHEKDITNYALDKLKTINSVNIVGNPKNKAGVISFTIKGIHPHDISTIVDEEGVAIRAGHHCCQILHKRLNLSATARASFGIYNTKEDVDILCSAIEKCRKVFELK